MNQIFYDNLTKSICEISDMELKLYKKEKLAGRNKVLKALKCIVHASETKYSYCQKAVFDYMKNIKGIDISHFKKMLQTVWGGMKLEIAEEIFLTKYHSLKLKGYDSLCYLMFLRGLRSIATNENPYITEQRLIAMLPEEWEGTFEKISSEEKRRRSDMQGEMRKHLYTGRLVVSSAEKCYVMMQLTDCAISLMDEKNLLKLVQNLDTDTLVKLLKGLSGEARWQIYNVLSRRLAHMLAEDLELMGPVSTEEIAKSTQKVFKMILKVILMEEEE